jgi:hypothetical protein
MSTHCLTLFTTCEFDGYEENEVGHLWRKFDGDPEVHGQALKELLQGKTFSVAFELIAHVYHGLPAMLGTPDYRKHNWQYCIVRPDDPDIYVNYVYILSLQNPDGEMPRGGPHDGQYAVHLTVKQAAHGDTEDAEVLYSGPIDQYDPNEDWDEA